MEFSVRGGGTQSPVEAYSRNRLEAVINLISAHNPERHTIRRSLLLTLGYGESAGTRHGNRARRREASSTRS
jgi:hypothetical protein